MLSAVALHLEGGLDLFSSIPRVKLIAEVADRRHIELGLYCGIDVIVYSNKSYVVFGKHNVCIHSDLQIVSAKTRHILDDDRSYLTVFDYFLHFTKCGTVKGRSRVSVVYKELQIFEAVLENKPFVMNVYRCVHKEQTERYLKPLVDNLLLGVVNEESEGLNVREEDKEFIAQVYSYIFIGLMLDWIKDDMKEDPESIVHRLAVLIKDSVPSALKRFEIGR